MQHRFRVTGQRRAASNPSACLPLVMLILLSPLSYIGATAQTQADRLGTPRRDDSVEVALNQQIDKWIEMLGAKQFAQREKAKEQLLQIGIAAFEKLHAAQRHPDVEVRKQARYLIRAIEVSWVQEDDPESIKNSLRNYESGTAADRLRELSQLGRNPDAAAIDALGRLIRFDTSDVYSKLAALEVMKRLDRKFSITAEEVDGVIEDVLGGSQRTGAKWISALANWLHESDTAVEQWKTLYQDEVKQVAASPDKLGVAILNQFMRWYVERLSQIEGQEAAMTDALKSFLPMHGTSADELASTSHWLIDIQAWTVFEQLIEQYPEQFETEPSLGYCRAEMIWKRGDKPAAEKLVAEIRKMPDVSALEHSLIAGNLRERGLFDWAEGEFRHVLRTEEKASHDWIYAVCELGRMFHEELRHQESYETYRLIVDLMDQDKLVIRTVQEINQSPLTLRGQMHFSNALMLAERGDHAASQTALETAFRFDGDNADILIAMYRTQEADEEWMENAKTRIELLTKKYSNKVNYYRRSALRQTDGRFEFANALNQYAWLVSNTFGDFDQALRNSQESLDLLPESAGFLDTLARCYYALGKLEQAIATQQHAVELEPHVGQINHQLRLFEAELKKQQAADGAAAP